MKLYNYLLILLVLLSAPTFACIGPEQKFDIEFEKVSGDGDMAVKRKINGNVKEEILDDTGYLGAMLVMVELENHPATTIPMSDKKIQFLKERLQKLAVTVEAYDPKKAMVPMVNAIKNSLDKEPIAKATLVTAWNELTAAFYTKKYNFTAKTRAANSFEWSKKEEPLSSFTFPSNIKSRSAACSSSIQSFKMDGGIISRGGAPPAAKPSGSR